MQLAAAANEKLQTIRAAHGLPPVAAGRLPETAVSPSPLDHAQKLLYERRAAAGLAAPEPTEPTATAADWYRRAAEMRAALDAKQAPAPEPTPAEPTPTAGDLVRVYPGLATLLHARGLDPVGQLWHVMTALDPAGEGKIELQALRAKVAGPGGLYSWRRLRQVLNAGEGLAWDRGRGRHGRTWIARRNPARIIQALDGEALRGRPVLVPVDALTNGMHAYRAHVLAAWLAGRKRADKPISQGAIREATAVAESTQRTYHKSARIKLRRNIALGAKATPERLEDAHWTHGRAVYVHTDHAGKHGAPGARYIAENKPNSYQTNLDQAAKGRQRKINRAVNLVNNGTQGADGDVEKRYFEGGEEAWSAYNKGKAAARVFYRANPARQLTLTASTPARLAGADFWLAVPS